MAARLPITGQDDGTWGDVLNEFLGVSHQGNGSLSTTAITAAGGYLKPGAGIPGSDLVTSAQAQLAKATTSIQTVNGIGPDANGNITIPVAPQVYENFGVQSPTASSVPYFKTIGLQAVRMGNLVPNPWYFNWGVNGRHTAALFKEAGFWVQYDVADAVSQNGFSHPITAANWHYFHDAVVAEAAYLQSQGLVFDAFGLGNELENYIDNSTLTYVGLYNNLQQLALDVRAVYSGPVTYNFFAWPITSYQGWYPGRGWNEGGIGNFDVISIHPYAIITSPVVPIASGTVNNGQWIGDVPNEQFQYSLNFNGSNTDVYLGSSTELSGLTDFTWAGWVKQDTAAKGVVWSNFFHWSTDKGQQIVLGGYSNQPTIQLYQGNAEVISGYPSYTVGDWFFLVVTQVGATVNMYVNDYPVATNKTLTPVGPHATIHSFLGAEGGTGFRFNGEMCGVGIWNRGLNATERAQAMAGSLPQSGLVGHYLVPSGTVTPASISFDKVNEMLSSWSAVMGDKLYVSEFNLDSNSLKVAAATPEQQAAWINTMFSAIRTTVGANNPGKMIFYKYTGTTYAVNGNDGNPFNLQMPNGVMSPMWQAFFK